MIFEIPTNPNGEAAFEQRTNLEGDDFIFRFWYNEREDRWFVDLYDDTRSLIAGGVKLIPTANLFEVLTDDRAPAGRVGVFDRYSAGDAPRTARAPGFADLGSRVLVLYYDTAEGP